MGLGASGGFVVLESAHPAVGGRTFAGVELGRFAVDGDLEMFRLQQASSQDGPCGPQTCPTSMLRLALDGRMSLWRGKVLHRPRNGRGRLERMDVWLDASIGWERIALDGQPRRARPDAGVGLGWGLVNRAGSYSAALRVGTLLALDRSATTGVATRSEMPLASNRSLAPAFFIGFDLSFGD
jgi:hypothetical protein